VPTGYGCYTRSELSIWSSDHICCYPDPTKNRGMSATEFKAKCLAVLDEVEKNGNTVTVTKRGRPVATVKRAARKPWKSLEGVLARKFEIVGDIVHGDPEIWEMVSDPHRFD
jgi:prevent-host-death family protein